jgi:hypothetical protein
MTQTMIQTFDPLDPPTADEFDQAASILRRDRGVDRVDGTPRPCQPPFQDALAFRRIRGSKQCRLE